MTPDPTAPNGIARPGRSLDPGGELGSRIVAVDALDARAIYQARRYGIGRCRVCGELFERRSGNASVCQRARRKAAQRKHEVKRKTRRKLRPVERAFANVALVIVADDEQRRPASFRDLEVRWSAFCAARAALPAPGANVARQPP